MMLTGHQGPSISDGVAATIECMIVALDRSVDWGHSNKFL
jgi:hypothetical protein